MLVQSVLSDILNQSELIPLLLQYGQNSAHQKTSNVKTEPFEFQIQFVKERKKRSGLKKAVLITSIMILGIGVDILHLPRITALISRRGQDTLARRILSQKEYVQFRQLQDLDRQKCDSYLSARWCIKEAAYKALYPHHRLEWKQVTVVKKAGKPELEFLNSKLYGIQRAHVSLSHDGEYAIAQVLLEG